jgi:hypothetical protein
MRLGPRDRIGKAIRSCRSSHPVALLPASNEREKISFHQLNQETGNRIKYRKVDTETGDKVESDKIIKGYEVGKGQYIQIEPEELEAMAIESKARESSRFGMPLAASTINRRCEFCAQQGAPSHPSQSQD